VVKVEPVRRIVAATDRSISADRAVAWAADMASRYDAELVVLQVLLPDPDPNVETADAALHELTTTIGPYAKPRLVVDGNPAEAIVRAAGEERADVLVVGNVGMSGRKEFLLGNVPNRVSHNAPCTVVIVNTVEETPRRRFGRRR
jgi:ubiquinone biosynthesis protein